jgi:hypothetical protein
MIEKSERPGEVLAQFDRIGLVVDGIDLPHGWHRFDAVDFCGEEGGDGGEGGDCGECGDGGDEW